MEKKIEYLLPIADHVTFESNKGLIKVSFFSTRLDKTLMPNHAMKFAEIVLDKDTAKKVGESLIQHANRGNIEELIKKAKKVPLPNNIVPKNEKNR